jgi:hypothetical protein
MSSLTTTVETIRELTLEIAGARPVVTMETVNQLTLQVAGFDTTNANAHWIRGKAVTATAPASGQAVVYNGAAYAPRTIPLFDADGAWTGDQTGPFINVGKGVYTLLPTGGDDTAMVQAANDELAGDLGGTLLLKPGRRFTFESPFVLSPRVALIGEGESTVVDVSAIANGDYPISLEGTLGTPTTLTGNALEGDLTISVTSTAPFVAGGLAKIYSEGLTGSDGVKRGEFVTIASIGVGELTFESRLEWSYATADTASIRPFTPAASPRLAGFKMEGGEDTHLTRGILINGAYAPEIEGLWFERVDQVCIALRDCMSPRVRDIDYKDVLGSLGYALAIQNATCDLVGSNITGRNMRHLISHGGATSVYGMPMRNEYSTCTVRNPRDAGFDAHAGTGHIGYTACSVFGGTDGTGDGFIIQGYSFALTACHVSKAGRHAVLIQPQTGGVKPVSGTITGGRFDTAGVSSARGIVIGVGNATADTDYGKIAITGASVRAQSIGIDVPGTVAVVGKIRGVAISGCPVESVASHGVSMAYTKGSSLTGGNITTTGTTEAVLLSNCERITVAGVPTVGTGGRSIRLIASSNCNIAGNIGHGHATGISEDSDSANNTFTGNDMSGCSTPYSLSGTGRIVNGALSGSATWNPADLADGAQLTTTVTVTGAALGEPVSLGFSLSLQGMQLTGYVSAADTVTVVLRNGTGGAINLASGTLTAQVRKQR